MKSDINLMSRKMNKMNNAVSVVTAAGGNATAIQTLNSGLSRAEYELLGREREKDPLLRDTGVEQVGFLVRDNRHFEMAGGEFCGNAARAAAFLFAKNDGVNDVSFTMSGFDGTVDAHVEDPSGERSRVECKFSNLPLEVATVKLSEERKAIVVDLGDLGKDIQGIVHVLVEEPFPDSYEDLHRSITDELKLRDRAAVGVIWVELKEGKAVINPVVWVKAVDTFYYESSCGSGSIATARAYSVNEIVQPTGQSIFVDFETKGTSVTTVLKSEMEIG